MINLNFKLNGLNKSIQTYPDESLLNVLRANGIKSVKGSCQTASCGNCTVLVDGKPILSCSYLAARCEGKSITTIDGILDKVSDLIKYFNEEGAIQCGFCNHSLVLTIYAMQKELGKDLTDDQIRHYLNGNVCRCSGYLSQMRAIKKYLGGEK
mmetsp:Transcript_25946/g.12264  ORF Transcript_25946/g.12264 Transcript_25946/m.12264 type:complete len:153 (-) Transcript_25946:806-1264(-)